MGRGLNHYFGCQIRDQRGRFTPGGFLLEEFFEKFEFFDKKKKWSQFWFKTWSKLDLNLVYTLPNIAKTLPKHCQNMSEACLNDV